MKFTKPVVLAGAFAVAAIASAQTDIARWSFTSAAGAPDNNPTASTDLTSAALTSLGMTNSYNGGNTASCDVTSTSGDPNPLASGYAWRVRGASNNGWALAAPQFSQGIEFDVSTVGYQNILVDFDWFCTNQGIADMQIQYNLNTNNAGGWTNWTGAVNGNQATTTGAGGSTILVATPNAYNTAGTTAKYNQIDLSSIAGSANDANLGIRLVSCYDPTLGNYAGASGGVYNNSSGNWRFDQIAVRGMVASPELPTGVIFGVAAAGILFFRARRA